MDLAQNLSSALIGTSDYRDLVVSNGDLALTSDSSSGSTATDPVLQNVIQSLLFCLGEYFLDTSLGTPYFQRIYVRRAEQQDIDAILQDRILSVPGVSVLTQYSSSVNRAARSMSVRFAMVTVSGAQLSYNLPVTVGTGG